MNRGVQSHRNDGLVLLYDAAMLLEQHSPGGCAVQVQPIANSSRPNTNSNNICMRPTQHGRLTRAASQPVPVSLRLASRSTPIATWPTATIPVFAYKMPTTNLCYFNGISSSSSVTTQIAAQNFSLASATSGSAAAASSVPIRPVIMSPTKRLSSATIRTSHNELEKTRRANLRQCIEQLRSELPPIRGEAARITMLTVLKRASVYIKDLEQVSEEQRARLRQVERRRVELQIRRGQLQRLRHRLKRQAADAAAASSAGAAGNQVPSQSAAGTGSAVNQSRVVSGLVLNSARSIEDFTAYRKRVRCPIPYKGRQAALVSSSSSTSGAVSSPDSGYVSPQNVKAGSAI